MHCLTSLAVCSKLSVISNSNIKLGVGVKIVKRNENRGFTIVELLIVIVVIAILAAISIVAYNGIQQRARISTAQAELNALSKQTALFQVDNGRYPSGATEWRAVFESAGVYESTRDRNAKSFAICYRDDMYAIVANAPFPLNDGDDMHFVSSQGGVQKRTYDASVPGAFTSVRICNQTPLGTTHTASWSYQL